MGERPDDLVQRNDDAGAPLARTQDVAGSHFDDSTTADETPSDASTAEIREDITETRARMGSTIDAIQEKLSPEHLMHQARDAARDATIGRAQEMVGNVADTARETGSSLMDTIRQNPVPTALAAVGLGWLFISARREAADRRNRNDGRGWYRGVDNRYRSDYARNYGPSYYGPYEQSRQSRQSLQAGDQGGQVTDRIQDAAGRVSDQVQSIAGNMGDRVQDAASSVSDRAGDMADYAQWQAQRTRGWLEQTWNDNPLLMSGAALALGTVVGLSIPETPMENQLMGSARDQLVQKAEGVAHDTVQQAQSAATDVANQVKQNTADQQAKARRGSETTH
jgi:gas vesicle protein